MSQKNKTKCIKKKEYDLKRDFKGMLNVFRVVSAFTIVAVAISFALLFYFYGFGKLLYFTPSMAVVIGCLIGIIISCTTSLKKIRKWENEKVNNPNA